MDQGLQVTKDKKNDVLKLIAMATMLTDHIGLMFFPELAILRTIGRIAFPLFAYFIAVGFTHTSSRRKYFIRLLAFAFFAQFPYTFLNDTLLQTPYHLNILFLLAYSLLMLSVFDYTKRTYQNHQWVLGILSTLVLLFIIALPELLVVHLEDVAMSYSTYGLLMILLFYQYRNRLLPLVILFILLSFFGAYLTGVKYLHQYAVSWVGHPLTYVQCLSHTSLVWNRITTLQGGIWRLDGYFFQSRSLLGLLVLIIGQQMPVDLKLNKYMAYIFYPVHIIVLLIISIMMGGTLHLM